MQVQDSTAADVCNPREVNNLPVIFLNHGGGPLPLMDQSNILSQHLKGIPEIVNSVRGDLAIKNILIISAHYEESVITVTGSPSPPLLFDYSGFGAESYSYKYPAPGDPQFALEVKNHLSSLGIDCNVDARRGYDHGVFVPLLLAYPAATIPVIQLSLSSSLNAKLHLKLGHAIAKFRSEGTLIIGSGFTFHNLPALMGREEKSIVLKKSQEFDQWLKDVLLSDASAREQSLSDWKSVAPYATYCHPREEHLLPLFVCVGAASKNDSVKVIFDDFYSVAKCSGFMFYDQ